MLLPAWLWVLLAASAFVTSVAALATCLSYRRRIESIIKDASSVADLASKKIRFDAELEQCTKSLDENRKELRKLDSERKQQESLKQELANLSSQVAEAKQKRDEYEKEAADLRDVVSALKEDRDRPESEKEDLEIDGDTSKEPLENSEDVRSIVKLRVVKKHRLAI